MTKPRTPDSFADAMTKVLALLGAAACAAAADRAERTIYEWANPDSDTAPTMPQALALDTAYRLAGGEDAPFRDAFSHQLDMEVEQADACRRRLAADAADFAREAGEATAALINAAQPGASPRDYHRAMVEVQQVDGVLCRLRRRVPRFLRPAAATGPGKVGGAQE